MTPKMNNTQTLSEIRSGSSVRITRINGEASICQRLREMGLCESACVRKISDNGALICCVDDCRLVISEQLARNIFVEQI